MKFTEEVVKILCNILSLVVCALLFLSIGFHLGVQVGVDTKVKIVGEKYIMKVRGTK